MIKTTSSHNPQDIYKLIDFLEGHVAAPEIKQVKLLIEKVGDRNLSVQERNASAANISNEAQKILKITLPSYIKTPLEAYCKEVCNTPQWKISHSLSSTTNIVTKAPSNPSFPENPHVHFKMDFKSHAKKFWSTPHLFDKAQALAVQYPVRRKVRGDGNCFFTCLTVSLLEDLHKNPQKISALIQKIENEAGLDPDVKAKLLSTLNLMKYSLSNGEFELLLKNQNTILSFVAFIRHAGVQYIQKNPRVSGFAFISDSAKAAFCERMAKMGEHAEYPIILAAAKFLDFQIDIFELYVNQNKDTRKITINPEGQKITTLLLQTTGHDGHFDMLYKSV